MSLFKYYLNKKITQIHQENVKVSIVGDISPFPKIIQKYIKDLVDLTKNNEGMSLTLALNYGGRAEIVRATRRIASPISQEKSVKQRLTKTFFF